VRDWCDDSFGPLALRGWSVWLGGCSRFKVQGSRFKVQGSKFKVSKLEGYSGMGVMVFGVSSDKEI